MNIKLNSKKPYPNTVDYAMEHGELELFQEDSQLNRDCVRAIDEAIRACNYEQYRYKFNDAVKSAVNQFGFERVNWCMAGLIQRHQSDGRYSPANKLWAQGFGVPHNKHTDFVFDTHPAVLDGFADSLRKAHREVMVETVGQYEKSHRMADRNRLTWFHNDFGAFFLKEWVTDERLTERYNELMDKKAEKQSVLAQIKSARDEKKQPSAPKPERGKKKQEPEL